MHDGRRQPAPPRSVAAGALEDGAGSATGIWPLAVEDLRFAPGGKPLIDGITLQLSPGTRSIAMGPNGAGKSPFLRPLAGPLQPTPRPVHTRGRAAEQRHKRTGGRGG